MVRRRRIPAHKFEAVWSAGFGVPTGKPWANQFAGLDPTVRGGTFGNVWKSIAAQDPDAFFDAQHAFIMRTHYDPVVAKVLNATGLDINNRSDAVQDVVWSMSVQHRRAPSLVIDAIDNLQGMYDPSAPGYDLALISELYNVRVQYQPAYAPRYTREQNDAIAMLLFGG